jgi:hypothetical protein
LGAVAHAAQQTGGTLLTIGNKPESNSLEIACEKFDLIQLGIFKALPVIRRQHTTETVQKPGLPVPQPITNGPGSAAASFRLAGSVPGGRHFPDSLSRKDSGVFFQTTQLSL